MMVKDDIYFMKKAIALAKKSEQEEEVPVGAVIVMNNKIIASGRNKREKKQNALAHAEIEAINKACKKLGSWRLPECDLFVTLEPCPMCSGAIINSRIRRLVTGAIDIKGGAVYSLVNIFDYQFNHKPILTKGVLEEECSELLKGFFKRLRGKR